MNNTNVKIIIDLKHNDLKKADALVKKMLMALTADELDTLGNVVTSKVYSEVTLSSKIFDDETEQK